MNNTSKILKISTRRFRDNIRLDSKTDERIVFINEKNLNIPTGIVIDIMPYVLISAFALCAAIYLYVKKEKDSNK